MSARMRAWVVAAAGVEAAVTGLFLLAAPGLFGSLVLGGDLSAAGDAMGRLGGIVLISFGFACLPAEGTDPSTSMLRAMQLYNLLATTYLVYLGLSRSAGILLWPAVAIHAVLAILLAHTLYRSAIRRP